MALVITGSLSAFGIKLLIRSFSGQMNGLGREGEFDAFCVQPAQNFKVDLFTEGRVIPVLRGMVPVVHNGSTRCH